jgi:hypothetical protein
MSNEKIFSVLRAPRVSEKTARLQEINQYVFEVSNEATKADVKAAVEQLFDVKVEPSTWSTSRARTSPSVTALAAAATGARRTCAWPTASHRRNGQGLRYIPCH